MKYIKTTFFLTILLFGIACGQNKSEHDKKGEQHTTTKEELKGYSKAYFASGCFWCVEAIFEELKGVKEVISGYSGGEIENPTYKQVSSGSTKHAEAVEVYYDPEVISFETLVMVFFGSHDPTTLNQQGPDKGPQYRSIAFYNDEKEKEIIEKYIIKLDMEGTFNAPIVTQVMKFEVFYPAEDYHQNYEKNHPENPYVQNVSIPRLKRFERKFPELLK